MVGEESVATRLTTAETIGNEKGVRSLGSITAFFQPLENKELQSMAKGAAPGGNIVDCNKTSQAVQDVFVSSASDGEVTCVKPGSCGIPGNKCSRKSVEISGQKTQQKCSRPRWSLTCKVSTSSKWLSDSNSDFEDSIDRSSTRKNKQVHKSRKKKGNCVEGCKGSPGSQGEPKTRAKGLPMDRKQVCESECPGMANETCETSYKHCIEQNTMKIVSVVSSSLGNEKLVKRTSAFDILMNCQNSCRAEEPRTENGLTESPRILLKSSVCKSRTSDSSISVEHEETLSNPTMLNSNDHCLGNPALSFSLKVSGSSKADKSETSAFDFLMRKRETVKLDLTVESLTDSDMDAENRKKLQRKSKKSHTRAITDSALCSESGYSKQGNEEQKPVNATKRKAMKGIRKKTRVSDPSGSMDSSFDKADKESSKISEPKTRSLKNSCQNRADHQNEIGDVCGSEGKTHQDGKVSKKARNKKSRRTSTYHSDTESNFSKTFLDQSHDSKDFEPASKKTKRKSVQLTKGCENETKTKEDKTTICQINGRESLEIVVVSDRGLKEAHIVQDGTNKGTEPKNLAPIFQKKKPALTTPEQNESRTPEVSALSGKSSSGTVENIMDHKAEPSTKKTRSTVDNEAAMNAFKALFKGARLERTSSSSAPVIALPAPWPTVSHVVQKEDSESVDNTFWNLPWPSEKRFKVCATRSRSELYDGSKVPLIPSCLFVNISGRISEGSSKNLMFTQQRRKHKEVVLDKFSEAVIKSILLEVALVYPGVPVRKLYKRYKVKQENYKVIVDALEDSKNISEKNTLAVSSLNNKPGEGDEKTVAEKKERRKKKLSVDDSVDQGKKSTCYKELSVSMSHSTRPSRRKRSREDEDETCELQQTNKGRRLLTRLQKKGNTWRVSSSGEFSDAEAVPNRKKRRRTTNHLVEGRTATATEGKTTETEKTSEMLAVPTIEKRCHRNEVKETLWTDLYRPLCSSEVMANASSVSKLRSWLEEWKIKRERTLRKELQQQKRLLAKQKNSSCSNGRSSSQTVERWDAESDSDFQMSDASGDSDTEGCGLSTSMFISGPRGAGKTAMVYACAEELGYKVFEVNCASKRSGKQILSQLEEATQSHLVVSHKPVAANKSLFPQTSSAGLINKLSETSLTGSSPQSFSQPKEQTSAAKAKKNKKEKKVKNVKEKMKESCKGSGKPILKQPLQVGKEDSQSASNLSQKAASLILFEEVDIIFEEDKSFWMAVNSFMQNAKCPIILISTDPLVSCEGRYDHINLKAPSVNLLSAHLQLVALVNNLFINPEDLKAMVAVNDCDIRKSLMSLQFWAESGGGVMMQYKRPSTVEAERSAAAAVPQDSTHTASNQDDDTKLTQANAASSLGNERTLLKPDGSSSVEVEGNDGGVFMSGILNDPGEESMFLSLSDWHSIKSRCGRTRLQGSRRGFPLQEVSNSDSDFSEPRKKMLVCADGSADSVFEITDTNDSQPAASCDKKVGDPHQLPRMHGLLLESVHGTLNCVTDPTVSSLSTLQIDKPHGHPVKANFTEKLHITHFCQSLGVDVVHSNVIHLLPLFAETSRMGQAHCKLPKPAGISRDKIPGDFKEYRKDVNMFGDTSLFDDGTERTGNRKRQGSVLRFNEPATKPGCSSQTSTDTGFSETELTEGRGEVAIEVDTEAGSFSKTEGKHTDKTSCGETKWNGKALEVFEQFAENLSCADALCPDFPKCNAISNSSESTWWAASLKPGLTDEHVTVQDTADWSARDTRAAIRGAMELASLDSCFAQVKSLAVSVGEMKRSLLNEGDGNVDSSNTVETNALYDFGLVSENLPSREPESVLCWTSHCQTQQSAFAFRRKLHNSLSSCFPALYHCSHRCLVTDYLPTLRLLCHSERVREAANIKRRFLHYLDSNSFPLSRATKEALADNYMAS